MSRPSALDRLLIERLRTSESAAPEDVTAGRPPERGTSTDGTTEHVESEAPRVGKVRSSGYALARRTLRPWMVRLTRRFGGPFLGRVAAVDASTGNRLADAVAVRVASLLEGRIAASEAMHAETSARLEALGAEISTNADRLTASAAVTEELRAGSARGEVNAELLKAELRAVSARLDDIGWAVAPGAGPVGLATRFAELRERVNHLDRRLRATSAEHRLAPTGEGPRDGAPTAGTSDAPGPDVGSPGVDADGLELGGEGFDYVGFELRFRGDPAQIRELLLGRYGDLLAAHAPVLDVGCGRGELLQALAERGVEGYGVDLDGDMVVEARARGVNADLGDVVDYLRARPPASFGSIIAVHVVEHLPLDRLIAFLGLAASRLVPGGLLVAETPNPTSLNVLGNSYILDPTHVWPLHPSLLTFLCERAGFRDVRLRFESPATAYHLPRLTLDPEAPLWARQIDESLQRLNDVLFGAQEYAVLASTPG